MNAGGTAAEVVDGRDHDEAVGTRVHHQAEVAEHAAAHEAGLGQLALGQHADPGALGPGLAVGGVDFVQGGAGLAQGGVDGGQDGAHHGHQMRVEGDAHVATGGTAIFLLDLGGMTVLAQTVGAEGVVDFAEQGGHHGLAARAGGTGLGVDDDVVRRDQAMLEGGVQAQDGR